MRHGIDYSHVATAPSSAPDSNLASVFHERLIKMIGEFERDLDDEHEVGMRLVTFGQSITFYVQNIGYDDPSLIRFYGTLENGAVVELIQHVSQISFLLMAVKKANPTLPAKRIGFETDDEPGKEE